MFNGNKALKDYSNVERKEVKSDYYAISTSVQGIGNEGERYICEWL